MNNARATVRLVAGLKRYRTLNGEAANTFAPTSVPTCIRRKAVQAYLAPPVKAPYLDASNAGDGSIQNESHRQSRSLSPAAAQRSQWCSPIRPPKGPSSGTGGHGSASTGAGGSAGSSSSAAGFEKEGVPPLLLLPAEWGIGLGGEWVSARGSHAIRGASPEEPKRNSSKTPVVAIIFYSCQRYTSRL